MRRSNTRNFDDMCKTVVQAISEYCGLPEENVRIDEIKYMPAFDEDGVDISIKGQFWRNQEAVDRGEVTNFGFYIPAFIEAKSRRNIKPFIWGAISIKDDYDNWE